MPASSAKQSATERAIHRAVLRLIGPDPDPEVVALLHMYAPDVSTKAIAQALGRIQLEVRFAPEKAVPRPPKPSAVKSAPLPAHSAASLPTHPTTPTKAQVSNRDISVCDLLERGLVRRGGRLEARLPNGKPRPGVLTAEIRSDGTIVCGKEQFPEKHRPGHSLTEAAIFAASRVASESVPTSGWDFWTYMNAKIPVPMSVLRDLMLKERATGTTRPPSSSSGRPSPVPPKQAKTKRLPSLFPDDQPLVTAEPPVPGATYKNDRSHVTLRNLLDSDLLRPKTKLFSPGGKHTVTAKVDEQAMIVVDGGNSFDNVSAAARHAAHMLNLSSEPWNGWDFWHFRDRDGKLRPLDELRKRY